MIYNWGVCHSIQLACISLPMIIHTLSTSHCWPCNLAYAALNNYGYTSLYAFFTIPIYIYYSMVTCVDGWNESLWYLEKKGQPELFPALCQGWQVQALKHVCHAPWCARCVVTGYEPRCSSLDFFKFESCDVINLPEIKNRLWRTIITLCDHNCCTEINSLIL